MSGILKNILNPMFKHKKLSDGPVSMKFGEGITFPCRELGWTYVTESQDETTTADAVRRLVHEARASHLTPRRVLLQVASEGICIKCAKTEEIISLIKIQNVTYCSADGHYNHMFAFITTAEKNAYKCQAYLCQSAKIARAISLEIADAFKAILNKFCEDLPDYAEDEAYLNTYLKRFGNFSNREDSKTRPIDFPNSDHKEIRTNGSYTNEELSGKPSSSMSPSLQRVATEPTSKEESTVSVDAKFPRDQFSSLTSFKNGSTASSSPLKISDFAKDPFSPKSTMRKTPLSRVDDEKILDKEERKAEDKIFCNLESSSLHSVHNDKSYKSDTSFQEKLESDSLFKKWETFNTSSESFDSWDFPCSFQSPKKSGEWANFSDD